MASGSSEVATDAPDSLSERLGSDEPVTIVVTPAVRHLLAAATLASAATRPHVRVIGPDRGPPPCEAPITTAPGLTANGIELSPYTPLADVLDVVSASALPAVLQEAIEAIQAIGADPGPGIVATHDDVETAISQSLRLPVPSRLPRSGRLSAFDDETARSLGSFLAADVAAADGPRAMTRALESGLGATRVDASPVPTAAGVFDVLSAAGAVQPGATIAALLGDGGWDRLTSIYERAADDIAAAVSAFDATAGETVAVAAFDGAAVHPAARRWAATGLDAEYGLVVTDGEPALIGLAAAGERSASAVLETVANRIGGTAWGGPFVAAAAIDEVPADPVTTIEGAL